MKMEWHETINFGLFTSSDFIKLFMYVECFIIAQAIEKSDARDRN